MKIKNTVKNSLSKIHQIFLTKSRLMMPGKILT